MGYFELYLMITTYLVNIGILSDKGENIGGNISFHYKHSPQGVKYPIETIRMFHQLYIMTGTLTT